MLLKLDVRPLTTIFEEYGEWWICWFAPKINLTYGRDYENRILNEGIDIPKEDYEFCQKVFNNFISKNDNPSFIGLLVITVHTCRAIYNYEIYENRPFKLRKHKLLREESQKLIDFINNFENSFDSTVEILSKVDITLAFDGPKGVNKIKLKHPDYFRDVIESLKERYQYAQDELNFLYTESGPDSLDNRLKRELPDSVNLSHIKVDVVKRMAKKLAQLLHAFYSEKTKISRIIFIGHLLAKANLIENEEQYNSDIELTTNYGSNIRKDYTGYDIFLYEKVKKYLDR